MFENNSTTIENHSIKIGEYPIAGMTGALARVEAEIEADPAAYATRSYEPGARYQSILNAIEIMPARTIADIKAKAEALQVELRKDYAWDCDGDEMATARSLAESIMRDLLALK